MGIESQGPTRPAGNLTPKQVKTFQKVEPKALGSIQIIIAVLCLCLSITILQLYEEVHFSPDVIVVVVIVVQLLVSGSILIHAGRFPSLFWVSTSSRFAESMKLLPYSPTDPEPSLLVSLFTIFLKAVFCFVLFCFLFCFGADCECLMRMHNR
uniref:Uncharacterized protein n=1 Tax=Sinocyclocheilus anshuiensis TaxID=1608454 RepID=A0A671N4V8_9TELE